MQNRTSRLLTIALLAGATPLAAQSLSRADSLLAAGDTTAALSILEAEARSGSAEAHYRAGRVLFHRFLTDSAPDGALRGRAEDHFSAATDLAPDSAQYWLGLAEVNRTQSFITDRMQVGGYVRRALDAAAAHGSGELANVHYRAARLAWENYEELAHRYQFIGEARTVSQTTIMGEWQDVEWFFGSQVRPDPADHGADDRAEVEDHLRTALGADPRHVAAAGLLIVAFSEQDRWEEAHEAARQLVQAAPDSGRAWTLLGMTLARLGRWLEAETVFDSALQRMAPRERAPYDNLGLLLKSVDQARFRTMTPEQRNQLRHLYWTVSQPLLLTGRNEPRVEFWSRLTYVQHRWSDPLRGVEGYDSDRGRVYLRYGPPDIWAGFGRGQVSAEDVATAMESDRNAIVWVYTDSQLRFMFSLTPGFARTRFAGDFEAFYREAREIFPVRWDNVPAVENLDSMFVQFAQFRGATPEEPTQLGVYSFMSLGRMTRDIADQEMRLTTAALVRDGLMREVTEARRTERLRPDDVSNVVHRAYRLALNPGEYLMRVEAWLEETERGARSTSVLNIRRYDTDSLLMSDIVLADQVAPRDSAYQRWTDFFVQPSAGRFRPNEPVALLWEVYNLTPDSTGTARFTVDLRFTVAEIERRGFAARILGGIGDAIGLSAQGDDRVALQYDRSIAFPEGGSTVEYLTVDLEGAPEATYTVTLSVTDRVSGRVVTGRRRFWVTETGLVR